MSLRKRQKERNTKGRTSVASKPVLSGMIHNKIKQFSVSNPDAEEYCLNSEIEAGELLVYMAAACENMSNQKRQEGDKAYVKKLNHQCGVFKGHFKNGTALGYIASQHLELHGLRLVTNEEC